MFYGSFGYSDQQHVFYSSRVAAVNDRCTSNQHMGETTVKQSHAHAPFRPCHPMPLKFAFAGLLAVSMLPAEAQLVRVPGGGEKIVTALSGDGRVAVGELDAGVVGTLGRAFRWSEAGGLQTFGVLLAPGETEQYRFSAAAGVNFDGSVVVGESAYIQPLGVTQSRAFRWTAAGGMQNLGGLRGSDPATVYSWARGVSNDGTVVVGGSFNASNNIEAFRWTTQSGMVGLGILPGYHHSEAFAVSGNGKVVIGDTASVRGGEAFRWTAETGMVVLGDLPGGRVDNTAWATNFDGSVIVGTGNSDNGDEAYRWTQAGGMVALGDLPGGDFASEAFAVSSDGSIVVGKGTTARGDEAFRWTAQEKMVRLADWLEKNGVKVAPGLLLIRATGISADGSVIAGTALDGSTLDGFVARVSSVGSGVLLQSTVQKTLLVAQSSADESLRAGTGLLNGAHSRPLARRVAAGEKAFWLAGDWGRDDHGQRDGHLGLAEVGGGLHLGATQLNLALGQTWAHQNQALDSHTAHDSTYLQADWLIPMGGNWWGVLSAYGMWGDSDLRRGYLNAGMPDHSKGNANVTSYGLRARLEWDRAFTVASAVFSPYADASYGRARMDAYTERGGGFPAHFEARTEKSTELRLGFNAEQPLGKGVNLVGLFEAAHRFEKRGADMKGEFLGLFRFEREGQALDRNWLRAALGLEGKVLGGKGSLMLNATTKGEVQNTWLAAYWQTAF